MEAGERAIMSVAARLQMMSLCCRFRDRSRSMEGAMSVSAANTLTQVQSDTPSVM